MVNWYIKLPTKKNKHLCHHTGREMLEVKYRKFDSPKNNLKSLFKIVQNLKKGKSVCEFTGRKRERTKM